MVRMIVNTEYEPLSDRAIRQIRFTLNESFNPHLLRDIYCTHIVIWWTKRPYILRDESKMKVYAVKEVDGKDDSVDVVASWDEVSIADAIEYIYENLY